MRQNATEIELWRANNPSTALHVEPSKEQELVQSLGGSSTGE